MTTQKAALFLGTFEDKVYVSHLKTAFGGVPTYVVTDQINTLLELEMYCESRNIDKVVTTSPTILTKLVGRIAGNPESVTPSINNYSGSFFTLTTVSKSKISIVIIDPLKQLVTVPYGRFLTFRTISKLITPQKWYEPTAFSFIPCQTPAEVDRAYAELSTAFAIGTDIETLKENLAIRCVGYTGLYIDSSGKFTTKSFVIPLNSSYNLAFVRRINALPIQKVFQNGKYDNAYFLRYNAPPKDWMWDTAHFMHSWYSELPKDLAFLNAFFLREVVYWKDLAETSDTYEFYKYCALDTWATVNIWIVQMLTAPEWAMHNYFLEFPLAYPCLLSEMTGLQRDQEKLMATRAECDEHISKAQTSLNKMLGTNFNPASPPQTKTLLKILTGKEWDSGDEKTLEKVAYLHPLNRIIVDKIKEVREYRTIKGRYLRHDDDRKFKKDGEEYANSKGSKDFRGFWLYSLNPHHTDTGRLASSEHQFWCGQNVQNCPVGSLVKQTVTFGAEFLGAECDLEQAESRDTAHIVGSEPLIKAVTGTRDFHSVNASAFFGVAYDAIYDDSIKKTKDKPLRDLAKRVNHGANYNMGPDVLVDTMGEQNVWKAQRLLKLPGYWTARDIGEYLLAQFHKTYPELKRDYYAAVIRSVTTTRMLVSRALHKGNEKWGSIARGDWTRYCFGNPDKNKLHLNSYVAHCPQSLNARTLNEAYMRVFYELALPHAAEFRLHAQIHDSILFSFKAGKEFYAQRVKELMEIPVTVRDVLGVERTFTVPASIKAGKDGKGVTHWHLTE